MKIENLKIFITVAHTENMHKTAEMLFTSYQNISFIIKNMEKELGVALFIRDNKGMRYTQYRGLAKVKMELTLLFGCMNLKKMANWKWKNRHLSLFFVDILQYFIKKKEKWLRSVCFKTTLSTV